VVAHHRRQPGRRDPRRCRRLLPLRQLLQSRRQFHNGGPRVVEAGRHYSFHPHNLPLEGGRLVEKSDLAHF
ncbi:MAG: hypothetical protein ACK559_09335, partial [bacterium]